MPMMSFAAESASAPDPIIIEKVTVRRGRLVLDVRVADGFPAQTNPDIAASALRIRPSLGIHACINSSGPTFASVIDCTSLPHLFEHLIIDEQASMAKAARANDANVASDVDDAASARRQVNRTSSAPAFKGSTKWTNRTSGRACVQVSFEDDIAALEAVTRAAALLRRIMS